MKAKLLVCLAFASFAASRAAAEEPRWLITPEEVREDAAMAALAPPTRPPMLTRAMAVGNPNIVVVSPESITEPLQAPFPIRVSFKAQEGSAIRPESFRVYYGFLKVDITERLASRAKISPEGINVENAEIPAGNHRLLLRVSDSKDRQGETEIRFSVR